MPELNLIARWSITGDHGTKTYILYKQKMLLAKRLTRQTYFSSKWEILFTLSYNLDAATDFNQSGHVSCKGQGCNIKYQ